MEQRTAPAVTPPVERLIDWRLPATRRRLFLHFYDWALRYKSHPGGVYYVLPFMAEALGWDEEQRTWAAWINGNTQNPVTTLMLMEAGDRPYKVDQMLNWFADNELRLSWDTDRRYHRKSFPAATMGYLELTKGNQVGYWRRARRSWDTAWVAANTLPTMGRLSTWSYLEYLRILGMGIPDAETLMLGDMSGSRSHRNGLALVGGRENLMWWKRNPGSGPHLYTPQRMAWLEGYGEGLLNAAMDRNPGHPDVGYLTLESALCTFKSWHVPNRRYTNVYNDMLYDRLRAAEAHHGHRFDLIWQARATSLPHRYLMEFNPGDPGCVPVKQNHFLETGQPIVLGLTVPEIGPSDYDRIATRGDYAEMRRWQ